MSPPLTIGQLVDLLQTTARTLFPAADDDREVTIEDLDVVEEELQAQVLRQVRRDLDTRTM